MCIMFNFESVNWLFVLLEIQIISGVIVLYWMWRNYKNGK